MVIPTMEVVRSLDVVLLALLQGSSDILLRVLDVLNTDDATQENVLFSVGHVWWDDTRTVNEVNALHQGDVLPDLGLSGNRCNSADLLLTKSVDDGRLASVGVSDETDRDLLAGSMEGGELAKE